MKWFKHSMVLTGLGLMLAGCGAGGGRFFQAPGFLQIGAPVATANGSPVAVYTQIARKIQSCWLGPVTPLLKQQIFFARTSSGRNRPAEIILHERARGGEKGLRTYAITFRGQGGRTEIFARNFRQSAEFERLMERDLVRWADGADDCADQKIAAR